MGVSVHLSDKTIPCMLDGIQIRGVGRLRQRLDPLILLEFLDNCSTVWRRVVILQDAVVWEIGSVFFNKMLKKVTVNEPCQTDIDADQITSSTCSDY